MNNNKLDKQHNLNINELSDIQFKCCILFLLLVEAFYDKLIILNISKENWMQYISALLQFEINHVESKNVTSYKYLGKVGKNFINQMDDELDSLLDELGYDEYDEMLPLLKDNKDYLNIYKNNL